MNKREWHNANRKFAIKCEFCEATDRIQIHHKNYDLINGKSVYDYTYQELKEMDKIVDVCRKCHIKHHFADSYEEFLDDRLKHTGYCAGCGRLATKGWQRAETYGIRVPVCKDCSKRVRHKDQIMAIIDTGGQQGSLFQ